MPFSFSKLSYKQKSLIAEVSYLVVIGILSPFCVGLQTWSKISLMLSYVLLTTLQLPVIVLFYRLYLPYTVGRKKYFLFLLLFPFYILIYELYARLVFIVMIAMPFIPQEYRTGLKWAHPESFTRAFFNEDFGYTCLVLLAATSLYVVKLLFKNQHNLNSLETEKLKMELNHLKLQVQPHFFFNTLNNMYSLSVQNSPKTSLMITDLSSIMRYILYESRNEKVPLEQEVEFVKSYINLENLRHSKTDIINLSVQGNIKNLQIEPLLFLPLIENTFKHSLQKDIPNKWVKLVLTLDDDELIFQTSNPKDNATELNNKSQSGIGLMNMKKRLQLLYPGRHEVVIHELDDNFTVTLIIYLKPDND